MFPTGPSCSKGGQRYPPHLSPGAPRGMGVEEKRGKDLPPPPLDCPGELACRLVVSAIGFPNTYPLDRAIQRLCNRDQIFSKFFVLFCFFFFVTDQTRNLQSTSCFL